MSKNPRSSLRSSLWMAPAALPAVPLSILLLPILLTPIFLLLGACQSTPHIDSDVAFEYRSSVDLGRSEE